MRPCPLPPLPPLLGRPGVHWSHGLLVGIWQSGESDVYTSNDPAPVRHSHLNPQHTGTV